MEGGCGKSNRSVTMTDAPADGLTAPLIAQVRSAREGGRAGGASIFDAAFAHATACRRGDDIGLAHQAGVMSGVR